MIDYVLKSAVCLVVLLAVYHLFLEKEKMHKFNRFFLLFSLVFGLCVPVLHIEVATESLSQIPFYESSAPSVQTPYVGVPVSGTDRPVSILAYLPLALLCLYISVVMLLLFRFAKNLATIALYVLKNPKLAIENASLVLLPKNTLPYSFLRYIFINQDDYKNKSLEAQLLTHEMAHVRQIHSADILFIEILRIVFWFNPVFNLYKKAIQLNHEFLADEEVLSSYNDVFAYQHLLLDKAISAKSVQLVSNWNQSVTKTRLNMMMKKSSVFKMRFVQIMLLAITAGLLFCFSVEAVSEVPDMVEILPAGLPVIQKADSETEVYLKGATIWIKDENGKFVAHKYDTMTPAEKADLPPIPPLIPKKVPTAAMMETWRANPEDYSVWVGADRIKNSELANYKPANFARYWKNTFKYKGKFHTDIRLTTNRTYKKDYVEYRTQPDKILWLYTKNGRRLSSTPMPVVFSLPKVVQRVVLRKPEIDVPPAEVTKEE